MNKENISKVWNQIEVWLSNNASEILSVLNKPASAIRLKELEHQVGSKLPKDFYSIYRVHNGFIPDCYSGFVYGLSFYSVEDSMRNIEFVKEQIELSSFKHCDPEISSYLDNNPKVIPLGDDGAKCYMCVDLTPSSKGQVGQVIFIDFGFMIAIKLADSISELFYGFSKDLELGKYYLCEEALDDGIESLEACTEIDVINWINSPNWSHINID
ncbi:SMI1/KNR4 family protein [Photobacterium alginatilyticum]|uniref:SMI1/KNR4 family protein n=1 Tax=Photobacterium alginatilyticum TaxID=1775171 RepID=UPI0040691287